MTLARLLAQYQGRVLQVAHAEGSGYDYTNNMVVGSIIHSGVTITPKRADSKILALASWRGEKVYGSGGSVSSVGYYWGVLYRGSTSLGEASNATGHQAPSNMRQDHSTSYLDSPNTTAATTYSLKVATVSGDVSSVRFIIYAPRITLLEIGG